MAEHQAWKRLKANMELQEAEVSMERTMMSRVDEMFQEFVKKGGLERLKGKGKPLHIATGDPLYGILKTANVKPRWLEMQHEIREELRVLNKELKQGTAIHAKLTLQGINRKISRYNSLVPHYTMQRNHVGLSVIEEQLAAWE